MLNKLKTRKGANSDSFPLADFLLLLIPDDRPPNRPHYLASTSVVRTSISKSVKLLFFACLAILIQTKKLPQERIYSPSAYSFMGGGKAGSVARSISR